MSFSSDVKEELSRQESGKRHCQLAELAAVFEFCGEAVPSGEGGKRILVRSDNVLVIRKSFTLIKKTSNIISHIDIRQNGRFAHSRSYLLRVDDAQDAARILDALKVDGREKDEVCRGQPTSPLLLQNDCCRRAFIRGAFLSAGSMNTPEKSYHFEIVCDTIPQAEQICSLLEGFGIDAKLVERKKKTVVYVKEGTQIVDLLNLMGAYVSLMQMENVRILKDMRNQVNRQVNCETANLGKTVNAAYRQIEQIRLLQEKGMFSKLSQPLREVAGLRLEHPEASLKELGEMLDPPVGKSGVNHRLKKIAEIAGQLEEREDNEE